MSPCNIFSSFPASPEAMGSFTKTFLALMFVSALVVLLAPGSTGQGQGLRWGREFEVENEDPWHAYNQMKLRELKRRIDAARAKGKAKLLWM